MRLVILGLVCLSTFALAQNGSAIAPLPELEERVAQDLDPTEPASSGGIIVPSAPRDVSSEAASLGLLLAGLAGLTVVGGRQRHPVRPSS